MKILRLTTFLDYGGIESKMVNLSTHSDENEWWFCAIGKGGTAKRKIRANGKKVKSFGLGYRIPNLWTIITLYRYFKKNKPDIVHTAGAEANFHGVLAARMAGVSVIIAEEIGIPKQSKKAKLLFNQIYKIPRFIVGESQIVVDFLKENYKIESGKLQVVPNFTLFPDLGDLQNTEDSGVFTIISVSRLEPVKNIEGVVKTVHLLKQDGFSIKYIIIGEGRSREPIQKLVDSLGLSDEIQLVGFQSDPTTFFKKANLYVLNSFTEGFSNSLLEAMYHKVPSLSTNVGAAEELIEADVSGWIVPQGDDFKLYEKIKEIITLDAQVRHKIGLEAHASIVEKYSLNAHVQALIKLYQL